MTSILTDTLLKLHAYIAPTVDNWLIIGSSSLYLQGYPVTPNDIDILCSGTDALKLCDVLADFRVSSGEISRNKFRSVFSCYRINGVKVEVMGDLEVNTNHGWIMLSDTIKNIEMIFLDNKNFYVPSKKDQQGIYTLFGREKDGAIIKMLA